MVSEAGDPKYFNNTEAQEDNFKDDAKASEGSRIKTVEESTVSDVS